MMHDIVIVGAGPCGLAAAARICEKTPSALFTNDEHARYWKKHRKQSNSLEREHKKRKTSIDSAYASENDGSSSPPSLVVLDSSSNAWLSTWKQRFKDLKISHLRSPLFFHPDPQDRDGLLAYIHEQDRTDELQEIQNVVGKELSKHEKKCRGSGKCKRTPVHLRVDGRDQIDYFTPSSKAFEDYCGTIIDRYDLRNCVQRATVLDITFDPQPQDLTHGIFTVKTNSTIMYSRIVIVATGPSTAPQIPNIRQMPQKTHDKGSITHIFQPNGTRLPPNVTNQFAEHPHQQVNIMIVGGGLTSAQTINLLLTEHSSSNIHIHLLLRHSKLKQKPFDIDLPWVTKTRNHLMSTYWSADSDLDRLNLLRSARNGGSMTPPFARILSKHVSSGKLSIHNNSTLHLNEHCIWNNELQTWTHLDIRTSTSQDNEAPDFYSSSKSNATPQFTMPTTGINHIIFCTGLNPSFTSIPFLQSLQRSHPIGVLGGLPVLTDDLTYNDDIPLFFTGAPAAIRLGPGAANLAGARQGAERVAWGVERILGDIWTTRNRKYNRVEADETTTEGVSSGTRVRERSEFTGSFSNQFAALDVN